MLCPIHVFSFFFFVRQPRSTVGGNFRGRISTVIVTDREPLSDELVSDGICTGHGEWQTGAWDEEPPAHGWVLNRNHIDGTSITPVHGGFDRSVLSGVSNPTFSDEDESLWFTGRDYVTVSGANAGNLPSREISVEAWVNVNHRIRWGGILGYGQDNGGYERGFWLTYEHSRFGWALSTVGGGRLTYTYANTGFDLGGWHHVAASYRA